MKNDYHVIIPRNVSPAPEQFEISAAQILLSHFRADITFIPRTSNSTPDILAGNIRWEIKSPIGNGKNNLKHNLYRAIKQSKNIAIDARRSKLDVRNIRKFLKKEAKTPTLKRLILITKEEKVEVIK